MTKLLQTQLSAYCYARVSDLFAVFLNPINRGPNYNWDKFTDIAVSMAMSGLVMSFPPFPQKHEARINEFVKRTATTIANHLVVTAGFVKENV